MQTTAPTALWSFKKCPAVVLTATVAITNGHNVVVAVSFETATNLVHISSCISYVFLLCVWSPYTQKDIDMVEQVQSRAARFIFNNYSRLASISEMLTDFNWATLTHSRKEQKAVMLYKILHHL